MDTHVLFPLRQSRRLPGLLVLIALLLAVSLPAVPPPSSDPIPTPMKTFVIIFRQTSRLLTDLDKHHRAEETSRWARRQNEAGHKLDPHILAPEITYLDSEGSSAPPVDGGSITALLFLEAQDLSEATQVAKSHPALHYGSSVEVRPWAPPAPRKS